MWLCSAQLVVFNCDACYKQFESETDLKEHRELHETTNVKDDQDYQCRQSEATFKKKETLNKHKENHNGPQHFECLQCDKTFSETKFLMDHIQIHAQSK